jgi:hypothetical protein
MSELYYLEAGNNRLTKIPEGIVELDLTYIYMYDNPGEFSSDVYCTVGLRHIRDTRMFYKKYFSLALGCTYPVVRAIIIMSPVRLG